MSEDPKGKTIYLEIDDEVTTVYDRIKRVKGPTLTLIIPKRAIILQSMVNLKILKRKSEDLGKKLIIITNDVLGIKLATQAGFDVFDKIPHLHDENAPKKTTPVPLPPPSQSMVSRPTRIQEQKLSLSQLIRRPIGSSWLQDFLRKRKKQKKHTEIVIVTPSKQALITLVIISTAVLLVIAYIALPGATIALVPAETRIDQPVNITLADYEKNRNELENNPPLMIPSYRITPPKVRRAIVQPATGKIFQGENARGTATLINLSSHPWPLVATTRLQTEEGLIFRIQTDVTVPSARGTAPGTLDVTVKADDFDVNGQAIGERGNIGPTKFFLPGLKNSENRKNLYAESKTAMTGGLTIVSKMVTEQDISAAKERAKREIQLIAEEALKNYLFDQNRDRQTSLVLLPDARTIDVSEPIIEVPPNLEGKAIEQFEVMAEVEVSGTAFVKKELLQILKAEMELRKSPGKTIVSISEDSLSYKIFEINKDAGKIKLTATIRGREQYNIDPANEEGAKLLKRIKDHILGKDKNEAITFIQNLPEIDRVTVKSWPFWAPTLPTVPDNIEFEIINEEALPPSLDEEDEVPDEESDDPEPLEEVG